MKTTELSRVEFIKWLGGLDGEGKIAAEGTPSRATAIVTLAWLDSHASKHPIICVKASEMREFLAFISTYVGTYVPFTAFFRVIPLEMLSFLPYLDGTASDDDLLGRGVIGVALVEAALGGRNSSGKLDDLSVQACMATTAAVTARCIQLSYNNSMTLVSVERVEAVRSSFEGATGSQADRPLMKDFWATALAAALPEAGDSSQSDVDIVNFLSSIFVSRRRGHDLQLSLLTKFAPGLSDQFAMLRSNREDRVRALEQIFEKIPENRLSNAVAEIIMGYAAAQVAEGSFSYIPLISRYGKELPMSPMWFGLFSGMSPQSDVLTISNCLGRRLVRQVEAIPGLMPNIDADLNYEESIIYKTEIQNRKIRTDHSSLISIELIPGVSFPVRLGRPQEPVRTDTRSLDRSSAEIQERSRSFERARQLTTELNYVLTRIQNIDNYASPSLFADEERRQPVEKKTIPRKKTTKSS